MRRTLVAEANRVDRLYRQFRSESGDDYAERLKPMYGDELEWEIVKLVEHYTGPVAAFASADALKERFYQASGFDASQAEIVLDAAAEFIERHQWFELHAPHGKPQLVHMDGNGPRHHPFGPGLVVACPCSESAPNDYRGRLATYLDLVPKWFRAEIEARQDQQRPRNPEHGR